MGAFLIWDVLGETLWVVIYVLLGKFFSGRVQALLDILGNLSWVIVGLIVALIGFAAKVDLKRPALPSDVRKAFGLPGSILKYSGLRPVFRAQPK